MGNTIIAERVKTPTYSFHFSVRDLSPRLKNKTYDFIHILIILFFLCLLAACTSKHKTNKEDSKPIDSISDAGIGVADMYFETPTPSVKDCFLEISEEYLAIPAKYRRTMLENYRLRDVLVQRQQQKGDERVEKYEYEMDYIDEKRGYMMFSVFNNHKEANYFLRYFRDSSETGKNVVGLSKITTEKDQKKGSYVFLEQQQQKLFYSENLFPAPKLQDFIDPSRISSLDLPSEYKESPPLLVWLPQKNNKIGIDFNFSAFGEKKAQVKSACRRTHLDIYFAQGSFRKDELKPLIIKTPQKAARKATKGGKRRRR